MRILLMGPPGSGKGTQGVRLAQALGIPHIAVGDLLRAEVESGSERGQAFAEIMGRGELISDDVITELITPVVVAAGRSGGYILDGFPRTLVQAVNARQAADELNVDADVVIWLDVPPRELIDRLVGRAAEQGRADDNAEAVSRRLQVYEEATRPLLDYYKGRGILAEVDASKDPAVVNRDLMRVIESRRPS
ncbi:adenylate kinase [Jatrophihabitans telluris]|uniref:Adenylate kinase n=1 Tax=Jatrophihabitans telluris TaxID=2038343 RepID=A0ABY4QYW5_9ACTN|nr:adenylate kinase [Jatrophihabitans telluris]UQX88487.1 adenylate kinase [Jatrophihabitans telluris]